MPLTLYTTIVRQNTIYRTKYRVSRFRIVTDIVTALDVEYYDDSGKLVTKLTYPTRIIRNIATVLVGVEETETPPATIARQSTATSRSVGVATYVPLPQRTTAPQRTEQMWWKERKALVAV